MEVARAIFAHTFLNLGGDEAVRARAIAASQYMRRWIEAEIARRTDQGISGDDLMGGLLALSIDKDLVRRTIGGMLVGSIDTTATCVAKIIAVLGDDPKLTRSVIADLDHPERLAGWCWEILRLWPHNPILLRQPIEDVMFGDMLIRAGSTVVVWTQAAMLDPSAFPDPDRLRPDRPVGNYLHFGGGLHVCAGRAVNGFQIPILVGSLLRRGLRKVGKIDWAGPFPDTLPVELA
jgi:cytochrome P450